MKLLLKKTIKQMTNRELRWFALIETNPRYEVSYNVLTREIEVYGS